MVMLRRGGGVIAKACNLISIRHTHNLLFMRAKMKVWDTKYHHQHHEKRTDGILVENMRDADGNLFAGDGTNTHSGSRYRPLSYTLHFSPDFI